MGALHGRLHRVLARHPRSAGATMWLDWSKEQSLELLMKIRHEARVRDEEDSVQNGLAKHAELLMALEVLPPEAFNTLPIQLLHGDVHDQQVIWLDDQVAALVDWEVCRTDPRIWELVRSLAFSRLLGTERMDAYLSGYREHTQVSEAECSLGLRMWRQSRLVGLWVWQAYFLEGNERVRAFFPGSLAELDRVGDQGWWDAVEGRFIRAACG